uniref:Peptidase C39 n=1 Tax=Synechococcus lacustris str. Tous TaxID=1910958 RepID=A0A2P7ECV9_9SYNE
MSNIRNLLENSSLLSGVSNDAISALCRRAELVELSVGKPFQRSGQLAPGPALVLQGRLRRIYQQPGSPPLSLGSVEANDWVGWASVVRGEPDLTLIASQITVLLLVPFSDAIEALRADQSLQQALAMPLFEETAVLLLQELERRGRAVAEPRQLIEELFGHWSLADPAADPSHGAIELLSGPRPASAMPIGALLNPQIRADLPLQVNGLSTRIICLPEERLADALGDFQPTKNNANALALRPEQLPVLLDRPGGESAEAHGFHRPEAEATAFATGATSRVEQALACISHLAKSRQLAFSADLVRRNLEDVEQRLGALKLPQVGLQLEAMGFDTRPMRARPWDLTRLEPPALIDLDGAFVMLLVAAGGSGVLIGDPRVGLQRWSVKQLEERLPNGVELLVIREGRTSRLKNETFGLGWFLPAFLRYPGLLSMTLITAFISQLLSAVFPLGVLAVIDQVISRNNISLLAPLTAVLVVAAIAAGITSAMRALVSADLSDRVDVRLGSTVVEHLMRLPLPYFEQRQVGVILFNVNQLYEIRKFIVDQLLGVGLDVIFALLFLVVLLAISPTLTLIVVGVAPILMIINIIASPVLIRLIKQSNGFAASASAFLYEVVSGIRTVKSQNFEVEARWQWLERYRKYTNTRFRLSQLASLIGETARLVSNLADVLLISLGAVLILANKLTIGALFAVKILSSQVVGPLLRLSSLWQGIQEMRIAVACLGDVMLAIPEVGEEDLQALPMPPIQGLVRFEEVSFRYGQRGPLILDQIDLVIQPGQFVGLVGLSGSGKSTLVQMIDRLYKPKNGRISIDGYDIEKLQIAGLRRRIGYVPQDSLLFEGTVLDNIRLNSPDASIEAVMEAARTAAAHDFILNLDNGYATRLGEKGSGLSGGQRQRVCLARTVLQDPSLLILDEATSALDAETERIVCTNLARRFTNITVLFITHRLTTLRNADRILFMNKGRICEDGSHDQLINQSGSYATLYRQQVQDGNV